MPRPPRGRSRRPGLNGALSKDQARDDGHTAPARPRPTTAPATPSPAAWRRIIHCTSRGVAPIAMRSADLRRALADGVRHQSVETRHREQHRSQRERAEQTEIEAARPEPVVDDLPHRAGARHRGIRIDGAQVLQEGRAERRRIRIGVRREVLIIQNWLFLSSGTPSG